MKKIIILVIGLVVLVGVGLRLMQRKNDVNTGRIQVAVSFYPLEFLAGEIGGGKMDVTNLTPAGAEPHDWEPTTADAATIEKSQLLLINGGGLEAWADKITAKKTIVVGEGLFSGNDTHIWLDPVLMRTVADKVTTGLSDIDPQNKDLYEANSSQLQTKLALLDDEFKSGLANCDQQTIITSHSAFGYLASRYGLTQVAISGLSPDEEPTAQKLAQTTDLAKKLGVKYIFFETLVSPRLAQTLAAEVGAQTLVFNPLEGLTQQEQQMGKNYFTIMRENLINLKIALACR
ncbi:MAG: zinc transport system substrate-binding protein [Microgenomates group bacterium Gr01-1014_16]|nr:MAG: zinc transport system substrate-binding protein [Microgenomates group bacterium Gr01-1014_16]